MIAPARFIVAVLLFAAAANAQKVEREHPDRPMVIRLSTTPDSRGETVYEVQGKDEKNTPPVSGNITAPVLLHSVAPVFRTRSAANGISPR